MDIQTLRDFVAVVQEEGISAAADVLRISQPTLSRRIRELEKQLGVLLFTRGNRAHGIELTAEGVVFYRRAREIVELADRAREEVHRRARVEGPVHIAAAQSNVMEVVGRAATRTRMLHPGVTFRLHDDYGANNAERLDNGLADFAVLVQPVDMGHYDHLPLPGGEAMGVVMRADDPLTARGSITPDVLQELPLMVPRGSLDRRDISGWSMQGTNAKPYDVIGTMNLSYNASRFVRAGFGYELCLEGTVDTSPDSGLAFLPLEPELHVRLSIAWRRGRTLSAPAEAFLGELRKVVAGSSSLL
ncbi:LysR family transcriptional regulator [Bifidobacterium cuniculi]|uniref:LysR family transcriptional regulator n=1 Tax=Bifidobacterium cuniculi TaxID=1688 RepID=A0A087APQ3_9BIFI|nr:LysR family transcriptional regulator [Bifidobacterium cuniculi]KFI60753.1 LysR family transcriptional regulator [Bifidobacterium cuniculi]